jgi:hypothetical protein
MWTATSQHQTLGRSRMKWYQSCPICPPILVQNHQRLKVHDRAPMAPAVAEVISPARRLPYDVGTSLEQTKRSARRRCISHIVSSGLRSRLHLCQLAAAAALSASVKRLRLGGKSGARLPTNGTFASGSLLMGRLCRNTSELCSRRDPQRCHQL